MLSLAKIPQLPYEISRKQTFGRTHGQTDTHRDGQPENIMPPATTYGGRRHNDNAFNICQSIDLENFQYFSFFCNL